MERARAWAGCWKSALWKKIPWSSIFLSSGSASPSKWTTSSSFHPTTVWKFPRCIPASTSTSVEFLIDCTTECLRQKTLSAQDCESIRGQTVILPYVIPASKENAELIALIRQLARDQMLMVEKNHFEECLACMRILAFIAAHMRQSTVENAIPPSYHRYCQKAKEYISQHMEEHISVSEIADFVGVNKNYLTNIFSSCEKIGIAEYINRVKLNRMKELIVKYNYSIKKASEAVGFQDVNYVSRIFKKYFGITISEYRRMLIS